MSTEENKALVRRWIEAINNKNVAVFDEIFAANYVAHTPGAEENNPESVKQLMTGLFTAFPDLHLTVEDFIVEGDKVVARWTSQGTHNGDLIGLAPTGKQVKQTGIAIYHIVGGKVVEEWAERDMLGFMQQLGAIPAPRQ
jgi:steroid delta-isomerase-like uncharacterized protein